MPQPAHTADPPIRIATASDLGRTVRARRKARGLTQADLAAAAGVGRRFVVELEQGKPSIAFDKALRVAAQLKLVLAPVMTSTFPRHNKDEANHAPDTPGGAGEAPEIFRFRLPRTDAPDNKGETESDLM